MPDVIILTRKGATLFDEDCKRDKHQWKSAEAEYRHVCLRHTRSKWKALGGDQCRAAAASPTRTILVS